MPNRSRIKEFSRQIGLRAQSKTYIVIFSVAAVLAMLFFGLTSAPFVSILLKSKSADRQYMEDRKLAVREGRPVAWWLRNTFKRETIPPDIVVLGSSQLGGLRAADATEAGIPLDFTRDFNGYCLQKKLEHTSLSKARVFVAAIPGAAVSDYCIVAMAMMREPPVKTLVLTVGPRDFMPTNKRCPGNSSAFRLFLPETRLDSTIFDLAYPTPLNRVSLISDWYQSKNGILVKRNKLTDLRPRQCIFHPADSQTYHELLGEYPFNVTTIEDNQWFKNQLAILEHMIPYLTKGGTRILIVNMPIRQRLRQQLSEATWKRFNGRLQKICETAGGKLLDLSHDDSFTLPDFLDNLHLSAQGGSRLATCIAGSLVQLEERK